MGRLLEQGYLIIRTNTVICIIFCRSDGKHHKHRHHHHHHHHEHHKKADLLSRRQRGSEVTLNDAIHRVATETEEAILLHKADLDEMTSECSVVK